MNSDQISTALTRLYQDQGHRIVFWNDPDREFQEVLEQLALEGVTPIRLDGESALEVKKRLELDDPKGKYLLYSAKEPPPMEEDWLLDIRHYAHNFRADKASILLHDLGLITHGLRAHLILRRRFFESRDRVKKLLPLVQPTDMEAELDRKMTAVLLKSDQPELFSFLRVLFQEMADTAELDFAIPTAGWELLQKLELDGVFWKEVFGRFGYTEDTPSLGNLLIRLLATDFAESLRGSGPVPAALHSLLLPASGRPNAVIFLSQWRDSNRTGEAYDHLAGKVARLLRVEDGISTLGSDALEGVMTFVEVEKGMMRMMRNRLTEAPDTVKAADIQTAVRRRTDGHWASVSLPDTRETPRSAYRAVYAALMAAAEFLELRREYAGGFHQPDALAHWKAYESGLHRVDQVYRQFCEHADVAEAQAWDILKPLREQIERHYGTGFLSGLALAWGTAVEGELLKSWKLSGVLNQQHFFASRVAPILEESPNRRIFVIISDAFRYEAARELAAELNGRYRMKATLETMLGVLPSCTALGMASLLPHKTLACRESGEVFADGKTTSGLEAREAILAAYHGTALTAGTVMGMKRDEARERIRGKRVVYIYHNAVDAAGDSASTESGTFKAVREAIQELAQLTRQIIDKLNGTQVLITADHGFLYQDSNPSAPDKTPMPCKPSGAVISKKRYLLGHHLPTDPAVWHGTTEITAGADGGMEFWVPKGTTRFHFVGGARFVHGGAMLQEIMIPLLTVNEIDGKSKLQTQTREVDVIVVGKNHKITTSRHRFQLIQAEAVSDRVKPLTLKVAVWDGDQTVTDIVKATFQSGSGNMTELTQFISLTLLDQIYDSKKTYHLRLVDDATGIERSRHSVTIDKAFHDDF
ncbi:MAG: hypothetical protein JWM59_2592 [Verrucomicrobiales bacterium]|nr:hypothetical protein [Verrucomicrobiales bacterium]